MKNSIGKIVSGGTWFEIAFLSEFRTFSGGFLIVAEGSVGFARRNRKQPAYLDIIAPPRDSPEQLAGFYLNERIAAPLLMVGKPAPRNNDLPEIWQKIWKNLIERKKI